MASLNKNRKFNWEIQFIDLQGRTRTLSLAKSKFTEKTAMELKNVIETLLFKTRNSDETLDKRTLTWIETACPELQDKLTNVGLLEPPPKQYTLEELWDAFIPEKAATIKQTTCEGYKFVKQRFFAFCEEKFSLTDLKTEDFQNWKDFLLKTYRKPKNGEPLSTATVAGTMSKTKAVFNWAVKINWLQTNPMNGVGRGSFRNKKNDRFIRLEDYIRLLNVCPCYDWVTIITLARIGGLRAPSEVLRLKWFDINWAESYLTVTSVKTERYGKATRQVPLFPELRKILENHPNRNNPESEFVISRYRDPEQTNLGTQFARIAKMAGLDKIPRPFDNMRASRSSELFPLYGPIAEAEWLGHSPKTAIEAYLQVRPEDIQRAITERTGAGKQFEVLPPDTPKDDENDEDLVVL